MEPVFFLPHALTLGCVVPVRQVTVVPVRVEGVYNCCTRQAFACRPE